MALQQLTNYLTNEQIARLNLSIEMVIEAIGPHDANGVLDLTPFQKHVITELWEWIDDELGEPDKDGD